ncbi:hypothetical protein [Microcoleus sp. herbarium12]|uniref:hypothetical protein n=1 Tax=Microcoleus sp. herbarium12 TaxID=3055437 RepID=UPI002FCF2799
MISQQISKPAIGNTETIRADDRKLRSIRAIAGNNLTRQEIVEAKLQALLQSRNHRWSESKLP